MQKLTCVEDANLSIETGFMTGIMMTMADVSGIISISPDSLTDSVTDLDIYPARYAL